MQEDLIIPHVSMLYLHCSVQLILVLQHHTFYDFIINKARGKSGPLFNFDVHDDVRLLADATLEKDESHAGKVVERSWYQRNKHIFPASRWEVSLRCSSWRPFANSLPQLSRCTAADVGIRCLTRRKTTESIPSLRLRESFIVSRFIRRSSLLKFGQKDGLLYIPLS